jgi:hypothetical protein
MGRLSTGIIAIGGGGFAIALVVDTTGSMYDADAQLQRTCSALVGQLDAVVGGSYPAAVADYKDWNELSGGFEETDYAYQLHTDFTSSRAGIYGAIATIPPPGAGGDVPEAALTALMRTIGLSWSGGERWIFVLTDADFHDPETNTGYSTGSVVAAALNRRIRVVTLLADYAHEAPWATLTAATGGALVVSDLAAPPAYLAAQVVYAMGFRAPALAVASPAPRPARAALFSAPAPGPRGNYPEPTPQGAP